MSGGKRKSSSNPKRMRVLSLILDFKSPPVREWVVESSVCGGRRGDSAWFPLSAAHPSVVQTNYSPLVLLPSSAL